MVKISKKESQGKLERRFRAKVHCIFKRSQERLSIPLTLNKEAIGLKRGTVVKRT